MKRLIKDFPRQIAIPYRLLMKDYASFNAFINQNNGLKTLYSSVYNCNNDNSFGNAKLSKIFFDFDDGTDSIADVLRLSDFCIKNNWKHTIMFSGRKGFHVYVFTKDYDGLKYPKDALTNSHDFFIKECNLNMDMHIRGNISQTARIPNTWHLSGRRFCIPVAREDLKVGFEYIKEKAKQQTGDFFYYCDGFFDIKEHDKQIFFRSSVDVPECSYELNTEDSVISRFLPCVQFWLLDKEHPETMDNMGDWRARFAFAVYCNAICLPKSMCNSLAKKYFGAVKRKDRLKNNYSHFRMVKVLDYAYERDNTLQNCETLWTQGLCPGKCNKYKKGGNPIYK